MSRAASSMSPNLGGLTKSSELKSKLDEIKTLVLDNSNNMELGKKVRNLFPLGEVGENQIKLF